MSRLRCDLSEGGGMGARQNVTDTRAANGSLYSGAGAGGEGRQCRFWRGHFRMRRPLKANNINNFGFFVTRHSGLNIPHP